MSTKGIIIAIIIILGVIIGFNIWIGTALTEHRPRCEANNE